MTVQRHGFIEMANLCGKNRKMNLDYSITDVQWEPAGGKEEESLNGLLIFPYMQYVLKNVTDKIWINSLLVKMQFKKLIKQEVGSFGYSVSLNINCSCLEYVGENKGFYLYFEQYF
jgi:hypothetical protein